METDPFPTDTAQARVGRRAGRVARSLECGLIATLVELALAVGIGAVLGGRRRAGAAERDGARSAGVAAELARVPEFGEPPEAPGREGRGASVANSGPTRPLPITEPRELAAALKSLDARERRVLELRYGLRGERQHVLAEVGRAFGVSRERARQLEARALAKLGAHSGAPATRR